MTFRFMHDRSVRIILLHGNLRMVRQDEEGRLPVLSRSFKKLYVKATLQSYEARQVMMTQVLLSDVIVTWHFLCFRTLCQFCNHVANKRRAHRPHTIVIHRGVARQIRLYAIMHSRVVSNFVSRRRKEDRNRYRARVQISNETAFFIRLLIRLNGRRINTCLAMPTCLLNRIRANKMTVRTKILNRSFLTIVTRENVRDNLLISSKCEYLMVLLSNNAGRFLSPINVTRKEREHVLIGLAIYVTNEIYRLLIDDMIRRTLMRRFATLITIRYQARVGHHVQRASQRIGKGLYLTHLSFLNHGRSCTVNYAQAVRENYHHVLSGHGIFGVNQVRHTRSVNFKIIRVNHVNSSNARTAKDSQRPIGRRRQFLENVRQTRAASASTLVNSQLSKATNGERTRNRSLRLLLCTRRKSIFRRISLRNVNEPHGEELNRVAMSHRRRLFRIRNLELGRRIRIFFLKGLCRLDFRARMDRSRGLIVQSRFRYVLSVGINRCPVHFISLCKGHDASGQLIVFD